MFCLVFRFLCWNRLVGSSGKAPEKYRPLYLWEQNTHRIQIDRLAAADPRFITTVTRFHLPFAPFSSDSSEWESVRKLQKRRFVFFHCFTLKMQGIAEQTPVQLTQIDRLAAADWRKVYDSKRFHLPFAPFSSDSSERRSVRKLPKRRFVFFHCFTLKMQGIDEQTSVKTYTDRQTGRCWPTPNITQTFTPPIRCILVRFVRARKH